MIELETCDDCHGIGISGHPDSGATCYKCQGEGGVLDHWSERFLALAHHVASWSKDPSTQVGCVIVNPQRIVVAMGYNGFPRGVSDDPERYENRPLKYQMVQHAEANALFNATSSVAGCTAYVTHPPCCNCAGALIQSGVKQIITVSPNAALAERFKDSFETSKIMFREARVSYHE